MKEPPSDEMVHRIRREMLKLHPAPPKDSGAYKKMPPKTGAEQDSTSLEQESTGVVAQDG